MSLEDISLDQTLIPDNRTAGEKTLRKEDVRQNESTNRYKYTRIMFAIFARTGLLGAHTKHTNSVPHLFVMCTYKNTNLVFWAPDKTTRS